MSAACRPVPMLALSGLASLGPLLLRRGVTAIVTAIAALAAATLAPWLGPAYAAQPHYRSQVWEYQANGEQVGDVLRQFAASQGLLIQVDEAVRGEISARLRFNTNAVLDSPGTTTVPSSTYIRQGLPERTPTPSPAARLNP